MSGINSGEVLIGQGHLYVDGVDLGYTEGGFLLQHTTDKVEVEVDQSYSPVKIHKTKETFGLKTNLAQASIANLKIVWEQTETITSSATNRTLSWGMNQSIVEHTLRFEGVSPEGFKRIYTVHRAVVWETGDINISKNGASLIPVTFRILPDEAQGAGKEYGLIDDEITE